ncbi:MAG: hypothetical protein HKP13_01200 [Gammaproteobacteria bacterium]|nr:hypothetical protein [Gammaproteobacteria bacterium]
MPTKTEPQFSRRDLETLASGRISSVFGPLFEKQDQYARQVRMPEPPLLLADRVMEIRGEPGTMGLGSIITETDVRTDSWYLHHGVMPPGIMMESGQADLLLISWLGADFLNRGERVYRLLGSQLTFHEGGLPRPGDTLTFDIRVDGHARQGDIRLFFFHYDCYIDGKLRLSVRSAQAGFFNDEELDNSAGALWSAEEDEPATDFRMDPPPCLTTKRRFSAEEVENFVRGNPWRCFGEGFRLTAAHQRTPTIPKGRLQLLREITAFDPEGGPWGRGYLCAETPVSADDWYFSGHFKNDPCMPGTLMADAALQAMAFYMAALGFTINRDGWRFEPVTEKPYTFVCRGQVTPKSRHLTYELFVESVEDGPEPRLFGTVLCHCDGIKVFLCRYFGVVLVPDWLLGERRDLLADPPAVHYVRSDEQIRGDYAALLACAWGMPSDALGEDYRSFNAPHRRMARMPGPPYHFVSSIDSVSVPSGTFDKGGQLSVTYTIPPNVWYFQENSHPVMPFCVLMETMLQPCGWFSFYKGFPRQREENLVFRNLDGGKLTLYREVAPDAGALRIEVGFTDFSKMGSMVLVFFHVDSFLGDNLVLSFDTSFGFFTPESMAEQAGLTADEKEQALFAAPSDFYVDLADTPARFFSGSSHLPDSRLRMIDEITDFQPNGGKNGLGFLRTRQQIDPEAWYFKAHFFQDPVQPGSLGIEAMLQALQCLMLAKDLDKAVPQGRFRTVTGDQPMAWKYRGQVLPTNRDVVITMHLVRIEHEEAGILAIGEGYLWVDGLCIYQVEGLGMRIVSSASESPDREDTGRLDKENPTQGEWLFTRENAPWLWDHCPTHTVASMPMMEFVDLMAQAATAGQSHKTVSEIRDVRAFRWAVPDRDGTLALSWEIKPMPGYRPQEDEEAVLVVLRSNGQTVARSMVILGGKPEAPPQFTTQFADEGMETIAFPYDRLFHGPRFQLLTALKMGAHGAEAFLDAGHRKGMPVGLLHPTLLDGITHAMPHDRLVQWFPNVPRDQVAYPQRIPWLRLYSPTPTAGSVRALISAMELKDNAARFLIRLDNPDGTPWLAMELWEFLLPLGRLLSMDYRVRRPFLEDRRFVPGVRLSVSTKEGTTLSQGDVATSNWLPGTLETVYDTWKPLPELTESIAVREHLSAQMALHPSVFRYDGHAVTAPQLPFNTMYPVVEIEGDRVTVTGCSESLDLSSARSWWREHLKADGFPEETPLETVLFALGRRFVRRVVIVDPEGLAACRGKPVLFLGNRQVGIESVLFNLLMAELVGSPVTVLANPSDSKGDSVSASEGTGENPAAAIRKSLVALLASLPDNTLAPSLLALNEPDQDGGMSSANPVKGEGAFLMQVPAGMLPNAAIDAGIPIIPVRFSGALPVSEMDNQDYPELSPLLPPLLPRGVAGQDWFIGSALDPKDLSGLSFAERKARLVAALDNLGPPRAEQMPNPSDGDFSLEVNRQVESFGAAPVTAAILAALQADSEATALFESLHAHYRSHLD